MSVCTDGPTLNCGKLAENGAPVDGDHTTALLVQADLRYSCLLHAFSHDHLTIRLRVQLNLLVHLHKQYALLQTSMNKQ